MKIRIRTGLPRRKRRCRRDACRLEYQEITDPPQKCLCNNPGCTLSWCGNRNTGDQHTYMRLHQKSLRSDREDMLEQETRAYLKSVGVASATPNLLGEPVFQSHPQWDRDWFNIHTQQSPIQVPASPASARPGPDSAQKAEQNVVLVMYEHEPLSLEARESLVAEATEILMNNGFLQDRRSWSLSEITGQSET